MDFQESTQEVAHTSGRVWRFADYEFDELARELRCKGRPVDLESKPLDILLQLLLHAGEVVTKEELLESVWPDVMVVDGFTPVWVEVVGTGPEPSVPRLGGGLI